MAIVIFFNYEGRRLTRAGIRAGFGFGRVSHAVVAAVFRRGVGAGWSPHSHSPAGGAAGREVRPESEAAGL